MFLLNLDSRSSTMEENLYFWDCSMAKFINYYVKYVNKVKF